MSLPDHADLKSFSNALLDYLSLGHFEVFENLMEEFPADADKPNLAELLPGITETTEHCMNFNDTYQADDSNSDNLEADLSELGEVLAERFDLEDQLLEALYLYNT
jgi:regulator of sigma D